MNEERLRFWTWFGIAIQRVADGPMGSSLALMPDTAAGGTFLG
eukprot:CAMPEP_0194527920 /NCGR_PEP_ID=MMETSP0253-20130528/64177_1 /TAXON_ID=2966 /ORGANISM="Noctiluca scintillans" /LENGTH=42 /DNA_ID= /DNA_START= /DNA_END= /DNA_ORIENTATION=